ncbi:MAG TPA: amidohydrolase family protein [Acetobacteraceae bacterium]|nr:amidohydrolase family protein [Acetobacteraceae bacterium]
MSIDGMFVFDSVVHGFDSTTANIASRYGKSLLLGNHAFQWAMVPDPYRLPPDRYFQPITADILESALFLETQVDAACYHTVPAFGFLHDFSPMAIGLELKRRHPDRMILYGGISPLQGPRALDELDRQVEEWGISGLKLYPVDVIDGDVRVLRFDDRDLLYPVLERCRARGVRVVAVHKAMPLGAVAMDPFKNGDIDYAAIDFPDLAFEVVHSGFAFLDEAAAQIARFPNVYVGLESTASLAVRHPRKLARILGEFIMMGGAQKLFWSSGASSPHPRPVLEAFARLEMPAEMIEGDGYAPLTREVKADILGRNYARLHGIDLAATQAKIADDAIARRRAAGLAEPWSLLPLPAQRDPLAAELRP